MRYPCSSLSPPPTLPSYTHNDLSDHVMQTVTCKHPFWGRLTCHPKMFIQLPSELHCLEIQYHPAFCFSSRLTNLARNRCYYFHTMLYSQAVLHWFLMCVNSLAK